MKPKACIVGKNPKLSQAIQEEIFAAGGNWERKGKEIYINNYMESPSLLWGWNGNKSLEESDVSLGKDSAFHNCEELSIPEFLAFVKNDLKKKEEFNLQIAGFSVDYVQGDNFLLINGYKVTKDQVQEINNLFNK